MLNYTFTFTIRIFKVDFHQLPQHPFQFLSQSFYNVKVYSTEQKNINDIQREDKNTATNLDCTYTVIQFVPRSEHTLSYKKQSLNAQR